MKPYRGRWRHFFQIGSICRIRIYKHARRFFSRNVPSVPGDAHQFSHKISVIAHILPGMSLASPWLLFNRRNYRVVGQWGPAGQHVRNPPLSQRTPACPTAYFEWFVSHKKRVIKNEGISSADSPTHFFGRLRVVHRRFSKPSDATIVSPCIFVGWKLWIFTGK